VKSQEKRADCCDDSGQCTHGYGCPLRVTMQPDHCETTINAAWFLIDLAWGFLAALGLVSVAALVGLYLAGFFHWLSTKYPGNAVLQLLFGT